MFRQEFVLERGLGSHVAQGNALWLFYTGGLDEGQKKHLASPARTLPGKVFQGLELCGSNVYLSRD